MADQDSAANATVGNPTPVQPAASVPDESQKLIKRLQEQVAGGQAYFQTGNQYGLRTPEEVKKAGALYQAIVSSGYDPESVAQGLTAPAPSRVTQQAAVNPVDPQVFTQSVLDALDQRETARRAVDAHQTQYAAEATLVSEAVGEVTGLDTKVRKVVERAVKATVDGMREAYPAGHPLEGYLKPADKTLLQNALKTVLSEMNAEAGKDMANKADALRAGLGRIPTAGNNGGLATPVAATPGSQRPYNPLKMSDDQKQAILAQIQAKRGA